MMHRDMDIFDRQSEEVREQNSRVQLSGEDRQLCESGDSAGGSARDLAREEWDFSKVPEEEWTPALIWEMYREFGPAQDEGKMEPASAEKLEAEFGADISFMLRAFARPWSCLPEELRRLMSNSHRYTQGNRIVGFVSHPAATGGVAAEPLNATSRKSDSHVRTTISLIIDWSYSRKRILARVAGILKRLEPANINRPNRRGRKDRDIVVALERIGIMRLLHHYTLSEIKRMVPEAWRRYKNRKWYEDRRRVLGEFRAMVQPGEPEGHFPRSWRTKGRAGRRK